MQLSQAISSLCQLAKKSGEQEHELHIAFGLNKFSKKPSPKAQHIPFSVFHKQKLCFVLADGDNHSKEKLLGYGVPESTIFFVSDLRIKFKVFQERRIFCKSYDRVILDERIFHLAPNLFGKRLFKELKGAFPFEMKKLTQESLDTLGSGVFVRIPTGPCLDVDVGAVSEISADKAEELIKLIQEFLNEKLGDNCVSSVSLKLRNSMCIPVDLE